MVATGAVNGSQGTTAPGADRPDNPGDTRAENRGFEARNSPPGVVAGRAEC
jgi:hypothetical protein